MVKYPDYMRKSIKKVEATRDARLNTLPPRMSSTESDKLLKKFHPDYNESAKRSIRIGPSKGQLAPHEVVDLLEAYPIINPKDIDFATIDHDVDVLIIGGGGAGIIAALWALKEGIPREKILVAQKLRLGDSNSKMSQGGIQVAQRSDDDPAKHYLDCLGGGHFTNNPQLVKVLVEDAPLILQWHQELGIMYDRDPDGVLHTTSGGGTCRERLLFAKDYTGMEIVRVLMDEFRNQELPVVEFTAAVELLTNPQGSVAGSVLYDLETKEYTLVRAKSTILSTGGYGRLHIQGYPTTNHYGATGDGIPLAYRVGARLRDMDSVQYHPTGSAWPEQIVGLLCTEKLRGKGAQPVNKEGLQFAHPLEPRDVETAAFLQECYEKNQGITTPTGVRGVWLDTPLIDIINGEGTTERAFSAMYLKYKRFEIDITKDPVLVAPTLHFQNGGVVINDKTQTTVDGLFVAGELDGGTHGKNRLMGNSILAYNVFGRIAGINAAKHAKKTQSTKPTLNHLKPWNTQLKTLKVPLSKQSPILLPEYRGEKTLSRELKIDVL
ncbi:MAG: FAD-binding protein [Candidatus Ranarchaeia archaeon]|jgi:succinate dehydrogenase / fumarate reductase flavoprotein subunit